MAATDISFAPFSTIAGSGSLSQSIAYHKPVIASDIPVHREMNGRISCLELFDMSNPAGLRIAITRLLNDGARLARLSSAAGEYSTRFSYNKIAEITAGIYEEAMGAGRRQ